MRHRKKRGKLGRASAHREATVASLVCSLIQRDRIRTTLVKAKSAGRLAERMVTLARAGNLTSRRQIIAKLRMEKAADRLFTDVVPRFEGRHGGYTRIAKLGRRISDGSEMVVLEWVGIAPPPAKKKKEEKKTEAAAAA